MRIRRRSEFQRVLSDGVRVADGLITLWALRSGLEHARLGLTVGRRYGNAVRRHRAKRLLREAFRLLRPELPGGLDLICSPRIGAELRLEGCMASLRRLVGQVQPRLSRTNGTAGDTH